MEIYSSENEQLDAIRRFFLNYGKIVLLAILLVIAVMVGKYYWQSHKNIAMLQTSADYDQVLIALELNQDDAVNRAEQYIANQPNNYGVMAALQLTNFLVKKADYTNAEQQLSRVLTYTKDENLLAVTHLRLARLQKQQKKYDDALKSLDGIKGDSWRIEATALRGDIYLSQGNKEAAKAAYQQAIELAPLKDEQSMLEIKLNNISG